MPLPELTGAQLERQDFVEGAIHELLEQLAGEELDYDEHDWLFETLQDVRGVISDAFAHNGIMTEMAFYPYVELTDESEGDPITSASSGQ